MNHFKAVELHLAAILVLGLTGCYKSHETPQVANSPVVAIDALDPQSLADTEQSYDQAFELLVRHKLDEASHLFEALSKNDPGDSRFVACSAYANLGLEQFDGLQQQVNQSLAIDPDCLLAKVVQAGIWMHEGNKSDEARKLLEDVVSQDESFAFAWILKGQFEFSSIANGTVGEISSLVEQSIDSFTHAIDTMPNSFLAHFERGNARLKAHRIQLIAAGVDSVSPATPDQKAELDKALTDLDIAIELNPKFPNVFATRAKIKEALTNKEPSVCVPDWCEALRRNPTEKPFVKILTECLYFPETFSDPSLPMQIEAAFSLLDADGKQEVASVAMKQSQFSDLWLANTERMIASGDPIPNVHGSREKAAARFALVKQTQKQALELVSRVCGQTSLDAAIASSTVNAKESETASPQPQGIFDASVDELEVKTIYEAFSSGADRLLLIEILELGKPLSDPADLRKAVEAIDDQVRTAAKFVDRSGGTFLSLQLLGEMAYFQLNIRVSIGQHPQLSAIPLRDDLLSLDSLKAICRQAFEKSIKQWPDIVSAPYDRLARLSLIENPNVNANEVANMLLISIKNEPSSARSIGLLIQALVDTDLIDDLQNYQYIFGILKGVNGDALAEVKSGSERIQREIAELKILSEKNAILGWIDRDTQSRLKHLVDVDVLLRGSFGSVKIGKYSGKDDSQ